MKNGRWNSARFGNTFYIFVDRRIVVVYRSNQIGFVVRFCSTITFALSNDSRLFSREYGVLTQIKIDTRRATPDRGAATPKI